ncbi:MAG: outer membrane protein assembly factor BamD (BamD/ComL family) [Saprospiraceae bacterium]|jgi:outer membrane protein assembly factor BamD (BamD/ComL family)|tara:strand:+ start:4901 stop:5806 length:906 start_codon:yes stop_codon:yes gene_type:complete
MKNILFLFIATVLLFSCKEDVVKNSNAGPSAEYTAALNKLSTEPGKASASNYLNEVRNSIANSDDEVKTKDYLMKGLAVAEEYKMGATAIGFLMPLLKNYPTSPQKEEYMAKLASALSDIGKKIPGDVLIDSYLNQYPNGQYRELLTEKQNEKFENVDTFIVKLAEQIFVNPDKFGINRLNAQKYVDACEAYALGNSESALAPEYLYRAAEMARTLKTFPKALSIYDWIQERYPNYEKSATTMFLKGFMLENELNDKESARKVYQEFATKYPKSDLQDDVKFLLDNIDKTDEEIMKMIEKK